MAERGATLVSVLITGFAVGPTEANCYLVAPRAGAAAIVIDPGDEAVPTLEYYFAVNDLTPAAVLLTHGHPTHTPRLRIVRRAGMSRPICTRPTATCSKTRPTRS